MAPHLNERVPQPGTEEAPKVKILVVDDTPENALVLRAYLTHEGYQVVEAKDGHDAVRVFQAQHPDLIIMDAAMPGMNGFEATRAIRRLDPGRWIPIIFLSAYASAENQARGLDAGGDDYLAKPVNLAILNEKIKAMRRIADTQNRLARYANALEDRIEQAQSEQHLAKHLLERIIRKDESLGDSVQQWVKPADHFSGDVVVNTRAPSGQLYIMIADATGHGLAAAISVVPIIDAFYRLTEKGFSVPSIVRELNRKVRHLMPRDRFVAAAIVAVNPSENSIQLWNGGIPDICFLSESGHLLRNWPSTHPPFGILAENEIDATAQAFSWSAPGQLIMYTDGLIEAEDGEGHAFGAERVREILTGTPQSERFDALISAIDRHIGEQSAKDDISLVAVACTDVLQATLTQKAEDAPASPVAEGRRAWKVMLSLSAAELRTLDVVPLLMSWLDHLHLEERYRGPVFIVLAELVNNALDHGLLHLDSTLKHEPDGFERYIAQRAQRLAHLESGTIDVAIEQCQRSETPCLRISVKDSGHGFCYRQVMQAQMSADASPSGRGIMLVKAITGDLEYHGDGNEAVARLRLS